MSGEYYDYTQEPTGADNGENPDDFEIAESASICPDRTGDDIETANSFEQIPPGEHLLVIAGFTGAPQSKFKSAYLNGRQTSFTSYSVGVRFALAENPRASTVDFFLLPPVNPAELAAYWNGSENDPEGKKGAGFQANKFYHFIEKIGFPYPKGGKLPDTARRLGNWKVYSDGQPRTVHATIEQNKYTNKNGVEKEGTRIVLFSFRASEDTIKRTNGSDGQVASAAPLANAKTRNRAPAASSANSASGNRYADAGLDNL